MSHTLSQLYKVRRKWLNLITCKLDLNKALIKQLLKNKRSFLGTPLGKHPLQRQHCDHTEDCVQQELSDLSGHSAPVLSLKGLLPLPTQPSLHVILVCHLVHKATWESSSLSRRSCGPEVGFKYSEEKKEDLT
jgi:hypothetical protein